MGFWLQEHLLKGRGHTGIYSVCSAHPWVIEAAAKQAVEDGTPLLLEATCNQVNQEGGYTGLRPADFRRFAQKRAVAAGLPSQRIIFGGDHLGPNPWTSLSSNQAMKNAEAMIEQYVAAGFAKIHLDASMPCADDPDHLNDEVVSQRAAQLCKAAERAGAAADIAPIYVIGTEVPPPGGASHELADTKPTPEEAVEKTWSAHKAAFEAAGLRSAWRRVTAIVVQPGVEFNHDSVRGYCPDAAKHLKNFLSRHHDLVFEAHSTDYQAKEAYHSLVRDGFAILKVGPALTFGMREALFALAAIEDELIPSSKRSNLRSTMEQLMLSNPENWERHYRGTEQQKAMLRSFSYSDRIRYYWGQRAAQEAVDALVRNLDAIGIPGPLMSQYFPTITRRNRRERPGAKQIVLEHISEVIRVYSAATDPVGQSFEANI